ncbi:hypothetical protein GCM10009740_06870 [Terrabacter terrae]|uniref:Polysaccharide chain length determinant N-terminal domain-containing protein n=1 Tax=Terrabacter terrae TaxID=318434 RepID=A0ABN2TU98_9MICO
MSEQIVDLRSIWAILRRHTRTLAVAAVAGGLAGAALLETMPPEYTSSTMVLFAPVPAGTTAPVTAHAIDTQVQLARSDTVLGRAGRTLDPPLDADEVADRIAVLSPTEQVLTITARGATAGEAERLATAVARADIDYLQEAASGLSSDERAAMAKRKATLTDTLDAVKSELATTSDRLRSEVPSSPAAKADAATLSQLTARQADIVLEVDALNKQLVSQSASSQPGVGPSLVGPASRAHTLPAVVRGGMFVGLGAASGLGIAAGFVVLRGRREKALRSRDQIADSIGIPVVSSVQSRVPRSVAGWVTLLRSYAPSSTDAWALHQLLQRFTPDGGTGVQSTTGRRGRTQQESSRRSSQLLVLTLDGDQAGLCIGPQLASFAAASGRRTRLVTTSQRQESTNFLLAACSRIGSHQQPRPGLVVDARAEAAGEGDLVVHCVTVSRQQPGSHLVRPDDAVTLLAVSAGGATAEELARVALAADEAGVPLQGIVVANPDALDRTTGRLPAERAVLAPLPSLMTGAEPGEPGVGNAFGRKR